MIKITCISDTHGQEKKIKLGGGDLLLHAGDFEIRTQDDFLDRCNWLSAQFYKKKVFVVGNHDFWVQDNLNIAKGIVDHYPSLTMLYNDSVTFEGIKIWGSPYSVMFRNWAFMAKDSELNKLWGTIPKDTDIIITHTPPYHILDLAEFGNTHCGSFTLKEKIKTLKPKLHLFGHIHEEHGQYYDGSILYINASQLNSTYGLEFKPVDLDYINGEIF